MNADLVPASASNRLPSLFQAVPEGGRRFWEFFTVNIRNSNTRRAYFKAMQGFAAWCEENRLNFQPFRFLTFYSDSRAGVLPSDEFVDWRGR